MGVNRRSTLFLNCISTGYPQVLVKKQPILIFLLLVKKILHLLKLLFFIDIFILKKAVGVFLVVDNRRFVIYTRVKTRINFNF